MVEDSPAKLPILNQNYVCRVQWFCFLFSANISQRFAWKCSFLTL